MGKAQRTKGHNFERELVRVLKESGIEARRILEFQEENANGVDVETDTMLIQCKCMKKMPNIPQVFSEFKRGGKMQMVVFRVTNKGTYAVLKLEDMLTFLKGYERDREGEMRTPSVG